MSNILLANISWNEYNWQKLFVNPYAGHSYARIYPGHESLNFDFNKVSIDTETHARGFVQWTAPPKNFSEGGLILFFSQNTETNEGEIVGAYGKVKIPADITRYNYPGFKNNQYVPNIICEKEYSLLFPIKLKANRYKKEKSIRLVGENGFSYKDLSFAEEIIIDELRALIKNGIVGDEFHKLCKIYKYYLNKDFDYNPNRNDLEEQDELLEQNRDKTKEKIRSILKTIDPSDHEFFFRNNKVFKRDNRTIALIKLLRDFKCQICSHSIKKKDGSFYIEAAHIQPKHQKGPETADNILLLCPNHHKEFDLGERTTISKTKDKFIFILNGIKHEVDISL